LPPEEKPEGNVIWIGGYYQYDEDRKDFLWVSGVWRTPPPGKQWVAGYWREDNDQWVWVPGFWTDLPKQETPTQDVTYLPTPPEPPKVAGPGEPPGPDTFYVPGHWEWSYDRGEYVWRSGFWTKVQPGYVWVAAHYRWSPGGYIYIPGYWDIAVANRGVLYAPVYVDTSVVGATYVYTPAYAVPDTVVVDALFVRPCCCHYYYGDYYEVRYREYGYTSCVVYSQTHYDSVIVYETRVVHREDPTWLSIQIDFGSRRERDPDLRPASTSITSVNYNNYVVNNTVVNNYGGTTINNVNNSTTNINKSTTKVDKSTTINTTNFLMPSKQMAAAKGVTTVKLDQAERVQAQKQAQTVQQVAMKRSQDEVAAPKGGPSKPVVKSVPVVKPQAVGPQPTKATSPTKATASDPTVRSNNSSQHTDKSGGAAPSTGNPGGGTPTTKGTGTSAVGGTTNPAGTGHTGGTPTTQTGTGTNPGGSSPPKTGTAGTPGSGTGTNPPRTGGTGTGITPAGGTSQPPRTGTTGATGSTGSTPGTGSRSTAPPSKPDSSSKDKDKDKKDKDKKNPNDR
jgi:hypothetical protein